MPGTVAFAIFEEGLGRGRFPSSGFEIALMVIAVLVLVGAGFLLRYLSRPRKPKSEASEVTAPEGDARDDKTPGDETSGGETSGGGN